MGERGPVLEVLFLATTPHFREQGWAVKLEQELESVAKSMGCSAIAVAAVPHQGINFWTERCGFEAVVPLLEVPTSEDNGTEQQYLGEPVSELGEFLPRHML